MSDLLLDVERFVTELNQEEERLAGMEQELQDKLKEVQVALKKVRDARTALGGKKAGSAKKSAPSKQDAREAVLAVLKELGVVEDDSLRSAVEARLHELGKTKQGLALRLKEALQGEEFVETPSGWRLAFEEQAANNTEMGNLAQT